MGDLQMCVLFSSDSTGFVQVVATGRYGGLELEMLRRSGDWEMYRERARDRRLEQADHQKVVRQKGSNSFKPGQ